MLPPPARRARRTAAPTRALAIAAALSLAALAPLHAAASPSRARAQAPADDGRVHLTVDDARDLPDASPGDGVCAAADPARPASAPCTLRAAFDEAGASGRATTIDLPAGAYTLTQGVAPPPATIPYTALTVPTGADVKLTGAGAASTVVGLRPSRPDTSLRHAVVAGDARLAIAGVTLRGAPGQGGLMSLGRLSLTDSRVVGCEGWGSTVVVDAPGTLTLVRTALVRNTTLSGLAAWGLTTVLSSTLQDNDFGEEAIYSGPSVAVRIEASAIVANRVGAVARGSGSIELRRTTVADNEIRGSGAGAVILNASFVTLEHATVAGNRATAGAGRLLDIVADANLDLTASVIADNATAGAFGAPSAGCAAEGIESHGASVVDRASCTYDLSGDLVVPDVDLGPLVDAGGPTPVRLPRLTSAAVGMRTAGCPAVDQRGAARPAGGPCAAGAAEPGAAMPPPGLLWPITPSFPTGGPDAPRRAAGVPGPPGALAVRGVRGIVARGRQAQALAVNGGATAVGGGLVDLPSTVVGAAIDGTTGWLLGRDGVLSAVDVSDPVRPALRSVTNDPVGGDLSWDVTYIQLAIPAPGTLWRLGWRGIGMRGTPKLFADAWDVSDPPRPRRTKFMEPGYGMSEPSIAWQRDRLATVSETYVGLGRSVRALEVLDPSAPGRAVPTRLELDGTPTRVALHGDHAFVLVRGRDKGAPDAVLAVDVRDAAKPVTLGWWPELWDDVVATPGGVVLRRGALLASADLSDPLRPRVLSSATWPSPPLGLRASDTAVIARWPDGREAVVDLSSPDGPRPVDAPAGGAIVPTVAGGGEVAAWISPYGRWRIVDAAMPDATLYELPALGLSGPAGETAPVAAADGIVWRATSDAIEGWAPDRPGTPIARVAPGGAAALAAAGGRLWSLADVLRRWDVGNPSRHSDAVAWMLPSDDPPIGLTADEGGAVLWSAAGRLWRVPADAPGADPSAPAVPLPAPVVPTGGEAPIVRGAADGDRLAVLTTAGVAAYALDPRGSADLLGSLPLPGPITGLAVAAGRAYAVAGDWLYVIGLSGAAPVPIVKAPAPDALGPTAIAGGRLLAAAGMNGLLAFDLGAPEPPLLTPRCGQTWPGSRTVAFRAPGADTAALRLDGRIVVTRTLTTPDDAGPLALAVDVPIGSHVVRAAARRAASPWRLSPALRLHADPGLPFEPLGVTFDDGSPAGPQPALDDASCSTMAAGWTVRVDAHLAVTVSVPVRPDLTASATVTATLAGRAARLAPSAGDPMVFVGTIPAAAGPVGDASASVEVAANGTRVVWRGRAAWQQVWLPWAGR